MSKIVLLDPLILADRDPEYAKMLLKTLEEEAKKAMVIKEAPKQEPSKNTKS